MSDARRSDARAPSDENAQDNKPEQDLIFQTTNVGDIAQNTSERWYRFVPERRSRRDDAARELQITTVRSHAARVTHATREANTTRSGRPRTLTSATSDSQLVLREEVPPTSDRSLRRQRSNPVRPDFHTQNEPLLHTFRVQDLARRSSLIPVSSRLIQPAEELIRAFPLPIEPTPGLRIDPFNSINPAIDAGAAFILDWHTLIVTPQKDVACYIFNITNFCAHFLINSTDDIFLHAGVATVRFMYEQIRDPGSEPSSEVWKHRGMALSKLRERLTNNPTDLVEDIILHPIIWLSVLEGALGNWEAHQVHKRRLAALLARRGGLETLVDQSSLKGCLLQFDTAWKLMTGESVVQAAVLVPQDDVFPGTYLDTLPKSLQQLSEISGWTEAELGILFRAHQLTKMSATERVSFIAGTKLVPRKYNDYREANHFLDMSQEPAPELGRLLALTLIVYSSTSFEPKYIPNVLRAARADLATRLPSFNPSSGLEEEALIWMWVLLINAWGNDTALHETGESLMIELQRRYPGASDFEYAIDICKQFLWTSDLTTAVGKFWRIT